MESNLYKLNKYRSVIEVDDFIDFLYSKKLIDENQCLNVWNKAESSRLHEVFIIIELSDDIEIVFEYLKDNHPHHEKHLEDERALHIVSVRGGFPTLPPNYVSRETLVDNVRHNLLTLQLGQKLVIHGMMGYGKSCLVNELLNNEMMIKYFNNCLFWTNLGDCHSMDNVSQPMWKLYTAASSLIKTKPTHCHDDINILKQSLTDLFLDERLKNSLLVLDDACSSDVLSYFDIKCKTVITTQNKNILANNEAKFIEVRTGFSKTESLNLFKKSLKINYDLPVAAEEIHNICQGHPMLIALIGSFLSANIDVATENNGTVDNTLWQYIKDQFLSGNYRLNEYNTEVDIPKIIKNCIEKLLPVEQKSLRDLYHDLAIFQQDVNIPPEVLEVLWDKKPIEVRNIMNAFAEKSLVVPFYHKDLKTYIYGIHDIHLNYLKDVTSTSSVTLHRKLISGYDRKTNKNYADLPNDNYTLLFIGYHLFHAEMFDKFQIYFDLKFLGAKLKAVGKEDVLRDMYKYEVYITRRDNVLSEKLNQYKDFIDRWGGHLYSYDKTDIIQYALCESKDSHLFKEALKLAKNSPQLYFQLQKPCEELDYSEIINIRDDITAACFVDSPQHILIGTTNGKIKLFYEQCVKEISSFVGHRGPIKNLIVSPDKRYFLSVSIDGQILLWKFSADSSRNSRDFTNTLPLSPKTRQSYWQDIYTPDGGRVSPKKKFQVHDDDDFLISAAFCTNFPDTFRIVTGSNRGNVIVWDALQEVQLYCTGHRGLPAPCVMYFQKDDQHFVKFACQESIFVFEIRDDKISYSMQLHNNEECKSLFYADDKLIAVSDKSVKQWKNCKKMSDYQLTDDVKCNVCSTMTDDKQYLVVSTNQSTVYILDTEKWILLREFENRWLAKSLDTFYDEDKSVHLLLIGSDSKTLQQCQIQPYEREPQMENMPVFMPYWKRNNALTAIFSNENKIQVFNGYTQISETEAINSPVTCTCFSIDGNVVTYGLKNGEIHTFNIKTKVDLALAEQCGAPVTYLKCYDATNSYRYRASLGSDGSSDSLDMLDGPEGMVICVFGNKLMAVFKQGRKLERSVNKPLIFYKNCQLVIVDSQCQIYKWDLESDNFVEIENRHIFEPVEVVTASFCPHKGSLAIVYMQANCYFLDVYLLTDRTDSAELDKRLKLSGRVRSVCFSSDGKLLALGFKSGEIKVWKTFDNYPSTSLKLHDDPVEDLLFSPNMEPILVSLGEQIAWWNLKTFLETKKKRGRPKSIEILENGSCDLGSMNIGLWLDRRPLSGTDYLLACIKLNGKAKYVSASNDFNSFLTIDDKGKVYIMEIIRPDSLSNCETVTG